MNTTLNTEQPESFSAALTADLLAGKYSPGEWLKQSDLEANYNANRFEVRIALAELNVRGLLEHLPNRGYKVCNHTDQDRAHLYEVRTLLEVAAARLVVQRATDEQIAEFEEQVARFDKSTKTGALDELRQHNFQLHNCLDAMCGNPLLADQIRKLRECGIPGRKGSWDRSAAVQASNDDHFEMLEMLKQRDADGLAAMIYRHLNRWLKYAMPESPAELD